MSSNHLFVGVKGHVVAFDKKNGTTLWRIKLKNGLMNGDRFVTLLVDNDKIFAHTYGELYCLDAATGTVLWKNALEGLSFDIASLAIQGITSPPMPPVAVHRRSQAESSGAAVTTAGN